MPTHAHIPVLAEINLLERLGAAHDDARFPVDEPARHTTTRGSVRNAQARPDLRSDDLRLVLLQTFIDEVLLALRRVLHHKWQ